MFKTCKTRLPPRIYKTVVLSLPEKAIINETNKMMTLGVDAGKTADGGEPQAAIARAPGCGLAAAVSFRGGNALGLAERFEPRLGGSASCEGVEFGH